MIGTVRLRPRFFGLFSKYNVKRPEIEIHFWNDPRNNIKLI